MGKLRGEAESYSIRMASRLTGIGEHALRAWERRYGFPKPRRTEGGARRYTAGDIERLELIQEALTQGFRAGDVVPRSLDGLKELMSAHGQVTHAIADSHPDADRLISLVRQGRVSDLERVLKRAVAVLGAEAFIGELAVPLCREIGERWERGELSIHHEHLISEALTTRLRVLRSIYEEIDARPRILMCTAPSERHALGMEMAAVLLTLRGASTRMLGTDTPVEEIAAAAGALDVDVVGLSVSTAATRESARKHVKKLRKTLAPQLPLWVGGAGAQALESLAAESLLVINETASLNAAVAEWRNRR